MMKPIEKVLLVDDDKNLLAAFKRQLYKQVNLEVAQGGPQALEVMQESGPFALVISDMQMPVMNGVEFLSKVKKCSENTVRIMLTGNANLDVAVDCINRGSIFRFLNKPVDKERLLQSIHDGIQQYKLLTEREYLLTLIQAKNTQLEQANNGLEKKVEQRTSELNTALSDLNNSHNLLKKRNIEAITAFSRIIDLRPGINPGHSKYIAKTAAEFAKKMGLNEEQSQDILVSGLLCQIGKMALEERYLTCNFHALESYERKQYLQHAMAGKNLLQGLAHLNSIAEIIGSQYEHYDGSGTPNGLSAENIPLGSRIIAIVRDYIAYSDGLITGKKMSKKEVIKYFVMNKDKRYDGKIVKSFLENIIQLGPTKNNRVVKIPWFELRPKMEIKQVTQGRLVYVKNRMATKELIESINQLHHSSLEEIEVYVMVRSLN